MALNYASFIWSVADLLRGTASMTEQLDVPTGHPRNVGGSRQNGPIAEYEERYD